MAYDEWGPRAHVDRPDYIFLCILYDCRRAIDQTYLVCNVLLLFSTLPSPHACQTDMKFITTLPTVRLIPLLPIKYVQFCAH